MIRAGAACIIVVIPGAILLVHLAPGFDINQGGMECAVAVTYRFGTVADRRA
jgi:hypothetical protein